MRQLGNAVSLAITVAVAVAVSVAVAVAVISAVSAVVVNRQSIPTPVGQAITGGLYVFKRPVCFRTLMFSSATFYYQFGGFGACGNVNPDSALIVALGMSAMRSY